MSRLAGRRARWITAVTVPVALLAAAAGVAQTTGSPLPFGAPTPEQPRPGEAYTAVRGDRASNWPEQTRSEVLARNGMVATSQPLAAQAGLDMLKRGGTAADAAIAAAAVAAVVEPLSTNLGADMFALYWSAKERRLYGLNASGPSPARWTPEYFASKGHTQESGMPLRGPDAVTVPGAIDGWDQLQRRFGKLGFREALEPAAQLAEDGFGMTEREHSDWEPWVEDLAQDPDSARLWLRDGKAPPLYSIFRNPGMAKAFRVLQRDGRDAFYEGPIADAMVRKVQAGGGVLSASDLADYRSEWIDPISTNYKGYDIHQMPPNSQGFAVLEMMNIVEVCAPLAGVDLRAAGPRSPEYWHFLVEAKKLAFNDLHAYNADPRAADVPVERLTSKAYARSLCDRIDMARASSPAPGPNDRGGTVYLTAADRWGNMVSFIYSIYYPFGAAQTVPEYGFLLSNRGAGFSLDPASPNVVAPRKRPFNTIIPAFVTRDGRPVLAFGNMGGPVQAQAQSQELVSMIDLGMNVQAASDAARFSHDQATNTLSLEPRLFDLVGAALAARGHDVESARGGDLAAGGFQGILFEPTEGAAAGKQHGDRDGPVNGVYRAGSDHRKDGAAIGW